MHKLISIQNSTYFALHDSVYKVRTKGYLSKQKGILKKYLLVIAYWAIVKIFDKWTIERNNTFFSFLCEAIKIDIEHTF